MLNQEDKNLIIEILEPLIDEKLLEIHKRKRLIGTRKKSLFINIDKMKNLKTLREKLLGNGGD